MVPRSDDEHRPEETQEFEDETLNLRDELRDEIPSDELDPEAFQEDMPEEDQQEESELQELISSETAEWDASEAEGDAEPGEEPEGPGEEEETEKEEAPAPGEASEQPTLVASAGRRIGSARSRITSGFEAVRARKITSGFKVLGRFRPRFPLWLRFVTASLVIVGSVAAATSASLILYLSDIASALKHGNALKGIDTYLQTVDGGAPQTILILGSDKDPELKDVQKGVRGLSDTTMLLRLDPDRNAIALFSLPRDLKVEIPGYGVAKLNEAYFAGGPELTLRTVQNLTGLDINHLVNVDFEGFARAVNAIDCVYVDVDRRYFNSNEGKPAELTYEEIDIQPGYQALCGFDALDYVRYRHTDNDVVRAARQQDFLREARQKVPPQRLFADRKELIKIFTTHTTSDIDDPQTMLQVLKLFLEARNAPLKEIHFEGTLGPSFVTATQAQIDKAVRQFLGIEDTPGARAKTAAPDDPSALPEAQRSQAPAAPAVPKKKKKKKSGREPAQLIETDFGRKLAQGIRRREVKLPIYYPTVLEVGTDFAQKPRLYKINGTGPDAPPNGERAAYKWVFSRPQLGEYYGFMATRWKDPPILNSPSETRKIGDREYKLYFDGDRLRTVAWQDERGSFWVSNTLIQSLSDREMIDIAKGMRELAR